MQLSRAARKVAACHVRRLEMEIMKCSDVGTYAKSKDQETRLEPRTLGCIGRNGFWISVVIRVGRV